VSRTKREILQKERISGGKISYLTGRNKVLVSVVVDAHMLFYKCADQI